MALDTAFYLVTKDIAIRSGLVDVRYRTLDNRFVLDNKDLARVRFTTDEYISGLKGVEKISESEAKTLIAKGGYKKGLAVDNSSFGVGGNAEETPVEEEPTEVEETSEEPTESEEEETNEQEKEEE